MATRWKKAQDEISTSINNTNDENNPTTTIEDNVPLPESRVDDEEMNDES
jgi:gas vesicle protein